MKPQVGDTFVIQYQIVREAEDGFLHNGIHIRNERRNKFWAKPTHSGFGTEEILVFFDSDYDPMIQAMEEVSRPINLKEMAR